MKMIKKIRRKYSISAPKLSVRPHVPWYVRWALLVPIFLVVGFLVWWAYDSGLELAGFHRGQAEKELSELRDRVVELEVENASLSNQVAAFERQNQIEHASDVEVQRQLKVLNEENMRLQEDLSFFQNLPLTGAKQAEVSVHRLKLEPDTLPGEYHCRMLLVQSVQQRGREFRGNLQLIVNGERDGEKVVLQFPTEAAADVESYQLNFKYYQRIDKVIKLPEDVRLESVQVRVFAKGELEPRIKQTISLL